MPKVKVNIPLSNPALILKYLLEGILVLESHCSFVDQVFVAC